MAKSSKKSKEATAPEISSTAPGMESNNGHGAVPSAKPAPAKKATKSAGPAKGSGKARTTAVKKTSAARKPQARRTAKKGDDSSVTDDQIRLRAYFISEWRTQNGVAGDSAHDWLEAVRQLQAEAARA